MNKLSKIKVTHGVYYVEIAEAGVKLLCGCPADTVKHLIKKGFIGTTGEDGVEFATGPNAILLSDVSLQHGSLANLAEFPVLHMLYKQGMAIPGHPNNTGLRPLLIGLREQVFAQLQYVYRGNYGLISKEEMLSCGVTPELADELMAVKRYFAFGRIQGADDFLDTLILDDEVEEIRNDVFINRVQVNVFQISYRGETVQVDLNLNPQQHYEPPYTLSYFYFKREYFAVIHSGEGDGWDENRPCMSSVLMFQGKIYLLDMPPNLLYHLSALGIGVNEVEGVFHTHCHDDHFSGITSLIRGDHKIKYYATPLVRASVTKKLSALLAIEEQEFYRFFDVNDLIPGVWNDIDDLEVLPFISPHPVETNIFYFRVLAENGYRSYAHLADLVSFDVLADMVDTGRQNGISQDFYDSVKQAYFIPADIKKIDIGGGLSHGNACDFDEDASAKIVLSHISRPLTHEEKCIGSFSSFGVVDVFIANLSEFVKRSAYDYLSSYFPHSSRHQLRGLLNSKIQVFNPGSFILKEGEISSGVYLVLTGNIEIFNNSTETVRLLSSGGIIGDMSLLYEAPANFSYLTKGYVQAIQFSIPLYLEFVKKNNLFEHIEQLHERRSFIQQTDLLGDSIPYPLQNRIAFNMQPHFYAAGEEIEERHLSVLNFVRSGCIERVIGDDVFELIRDFDVFGEDLTIFATPGVFSYKAVQDTEVYQLQGEAVSEIPIIRWKLIELYEKRRSSLMYMLAGETQCVQWREEYSIGVLVMDNQHKKLFDLGGSVLSAITAAKGPQEIKAVVDELVEFTVFHFAEEEKLLSENNYFEFEAHHHKHCCLLDQIEKFRDSLVDREEPVAGQEFTGFFNNWLINHILVEDRKYGSFINAHNICFM